MNLVPPSESNPPVGRQPMGQYYLLERIGRGGMAEIYKGLAYDLHGIKRTVVIKKILPQAAANREFIDMLIAEAKIAVMLSHGNIAQIYDLGRAGDDYFIVMEYVDGRSTSQIQRECATRNIPIPIPLACYLCAEIASGLDYMHQRTDERGQPLGIVHRDVSPQNVLISYSGTVKIIDFGIAKARTKLESTEVGILKGKFAYMSPEHARGDSIDHRSDIFSLGVILHELLTGKRLFKAKDHRETLKNVRRAQVPLPSSLRADIPPELDAIVMRALSKECGTRYQRAATLRDDLMKVIVLHYPEFRDHQLADFLQTLFVEGTTTGEDDVENKTPFLIIDHTQSAIASPRADLPMTTEAMIPAVMAEFMLPSDVTETRHLATIPEDDAVAVAPEEEQSETIIAPSLVQRVRAVWNARTVRGVTVGLVGCFAFAAIWYLIARTPRLDRELPHHATAASVAPITLRLISDPAGAMIYINDVETGMRTPTTITTLAVNTPYTIGLHLSGYKFWSVPKRFTAPTEEELSVPLEVDYGGLSVVSVPAGAEVTINGQIAGRTPLQRERVLPNEVMRITVTLPGYEPFSQQYRVRPGHTVDVRAALVRQQKRIAK